MKKVRIKEDIKIIGFGYVRKGEIYKVEKYNSRFVYLNVCGCELRLSVKEVEKVK